MSFTTSMTLSMCLIALIAIGYAFLILDAEHNDREDQQDSDS